MKRTLTITSAMLLGASLLASPVMAQVSVGADVGVDANVGLNTGSGTSASGSTGVDGSVSVGAGGSGTNISGSTNVDGSVNAGTGGNNGSGLNADGSLNAGADATVNTDDDGATATAGSNTNPNANASADASADADDDDATDGTTTASTGNQTFDDFMSALSSQDGAKAAQDFQAGQTITVVSAATLCENDLEQQCVDAMESNQAGMAEVRGAIDENTTLSAALQSQDIESSSVVAARTNADGSMTIFTAE